MNYKNYMSYSIQKIFGSYSINIEKGNCTQSFYDVQEDIIDIIKYLERENQELNKRLEEHKNKVNWYENFEINKTIDKLRIKHNNQQKEFISYLENMLGNENDIFSVVRVKDVLSKYRSIIGGKDE